MTSSCSIHLRYILLLMFKLGFSFELGSLVTLAKGSLRFEQYLVYGELHLWQRNMKLLEEKCWLMMKMMMIKATKMRTCRPWCLGYKREKRYTIKIPTYFGAEEEDDDIPDMEEFDEADNVVENDTVTLQSTYPVAHEPDDNILRTCTNDINQTHNTSLHFT
ncbi:hypothetical protein F2Q70_00006047 [Brassica cretica]|uniref:Uncharacterized protein n=1 Tax=Brassica cretica TaxID=69181 RepID=A0A8S9IPY8_BRACR|nr:hypothetical protein F2Q70_00006047 [Brassica cretica]